MLTPEQSGRLAAAFRTAGVEATLTIAQAERIAAEADLPLRAVEYFALGQGVIPQRYDRNVLAIGAEGQRKVLAARVVVVGLGGLGGSVTESLARLGVGRIVGIDGDRFDESNLNRQLLSTVANLGQPKAEQAARRVGEVNPSVEFTGHAARFQDVPAEVLDDCDLVFDCLDNLPSRLDLERLCTDANVTFIHGAIAGWCGQVGVCPPGSGMMAKIYAGKPHGLERTLGNVACSVSAGANLMVARGLRILLDPAAGARAELQFFDLQTDDWETVEF